MEKFAATRQFPKHTQLVFAVFGRSDSSSIGEIRHQLDINGNRYTLTAEKKTTGLVGILEKEQLIQTSYGKIDEHGFQPEIFKKEKTLDGKKQSLKATFDWTTQELHSSHGDDIALHGDTQDTLSFMYQLSQLSLSSIHSEYFSLPVTDGIQLDQYQIEIGITESISTPMGKLTALHLRKMHSQGEAYFEIWLGTEYRLLPVKFRQVDTSDNVIEEFVISDIRIADE